MSLDFELDLRIRQLNRETANMGLDLWQKYGTPEDYAAAGHLHLNVTDWWFGTDAAEMFLVGTGGSMDPVIFAYGGNDVLLGNYQEDVFSGRRGRRPALRLGGERRAPRPGR